MLKLLLNATGALWANDSLNCLLISFTETYSKQLGMERAGAGDLCFMERAGAEHLYCEGLYDNVCPTVSGVTAVTEVYVSLLDVAGSTLCQGNASPVFPQEFQARNRHH